MSKIKTINNYSRNLFVLSVFFFTLVASFLFFDVFGKNNKAKAEVCSSPVDVMMVIDRSGSMSEIVDAEQKIETAKTAALNFVDNLNSDNDQIGLEIFANSASIFDPGLTDNFGFIYDEINLIGVEDGGQTNTEAAIVLARGELINDGRSNTIKVMVILSDGVPNRQISTGDPVEKAIIAADIAKENGIRIISVGFDIPVNDPAEIFMQEIASAPGDYYSSNNPPSCGEENYLVCIYNQISASICDNTSPVITKVEKNRVGTLYTQDDLIVASQISDNFGFKEHKIKWSTDDWLTENIEPCAVSAGTINTCEKNIGTFGAGTTVFYKSYVIDTNDNETEGTETGNTYKSVEVASIILEINGDVNGKFQRNQNNTIKINISDPQGMANDDSFYVSVDSIDKGEEMEFNKKLMSNCNGDGYNWSCSNSEFNSDFVDCSWTDASVDVYIYPYSNDIGYHNYVTTESVELESIEENLDNGTCSDFIDNDCDGLTDFGESLCDNVAPVVIIKREVSGVEVVNVYNNNSVTLSSTAVDYPIDLNGLISHTIYWYKNGVFQGVQSCGSVANCEIDIGIFPVGIKIEYYVKATDSSVSSNFACGPAGCSTYDSFVVKDFECDGQDDLAECLTDGVCCDSICDINQDGNLYDSECSIAGCNGNDWGWVTDNETGDCDDGANSNGCYATGTGCEERNYSCLLGSCIPVIYDEFDDVCVELTLNDYGCNGDQCEIISSGIDAGCDTMLDSLFVNAYNNESALICGGSEAVGEVLDNRTNTISLQSSASDSNDISEQKIYWKKNTEASFTVTNCNVASCGTAANPCDCTENIGPFNIGDMVEFYTSSKDDSPNQTEAVKGSLAGLRYYYYDGNSFNIYRGSDVDTNISHSWGSGEVSINANSWENQYDTVSIAWDGTVSPDVLGIYTFYVSTDDGIRLYLDGNLVIDNWFLQGTTEYSTVYNFTSLKSVPIRVEWYENGGGATMQLGWKSPSGSKVYPIPAGNLTAPYFFTVADSSCSLASDMTTCTVASGSGRCCDSLCDTSFDSTTLYDTECMIQGCNAESWEYVPIEDGESCNTAGENACFDYFSGCENRDYSCATGICLYASAGSSTDICSGNIFEDYECSGADCSSLNHDCSDCTCGCGSYALDEKIYSSLSFDGDGDYVSIPSINPTNAITVSAWVKSSSTTGYSGVWQIVSKYSAYILGTSSTGGNNMCFITYDTTWRYGSCYAVPDPENWHYFVGTYDSLTNVKNLYVDGILRDTTNPSGLLRLDTGPINIGHRECCSGYYFSGLIDEVRIYNRALAEDEAFQHYQGVYQDESGLVGHWKFDDEGTVALDSSGNGNNGTLVNGPTWVTSFDDVNNVPSYWRTCSDTKNNDCDLDIDEFDTGCDGELTSLSVSAEYGVSLENTIPDDGDIYRSDMGTFQLTSVAIDDIFGISEHFIYWKINGVGLTFKDCVSSGTPSTCSINEINFGSLSIGDVVEYKSYAVDTNNNSKCYPADCNDYYSFTVRDLECYDIDTETNVSGKCESETGECCGGICDTSFDDLNSNGYDADCKVEGCAGESWEWVSKSDGTSCNETASDLCSVFSVNGCETTGYSCSLGLCGYKPTDQKTDYCTGNLFTDFGCDGACASADYDCSVAGTFDGDSVACNCNCGSYDLDEKVYSSLSFDGDGDFVEIPNDLSLNITGDKVSISAWVFVGNQVSDAGIITKGPSVNTERYMLGITSDERPRMRVYTGSYTQAVADDALAQNEWHHLVGTYDGSEIKIYVDGFVAKSISKSGNLFSSSDSVVIGRRTLTDDRFYNGLIDEARIYDRALSEGEALQHFQGVYQNEAGLVGHWKFDDTLTAGTAIDSSGNSNNGVLNGPTWAKSFEDANKNNVPSYWQACTDNKDNDCSAKKDNQELACDGELDMLNIKAEDRNGNIIGDGDEVKDINTDKISLIATLIDFDSGIKEVTIYWTADGTSGQKTCVYSDGDFEDDETCLAEIGPFDADVLVEYNTQGFDNNNNSKCYPNNCVSMFSFDVILSNIAPVVSELRKQQNESYCYGLDNVLFLWIYDDPDAEPSINTQDRYEIQIKKGNLFDEPIDFEFFDSGLLLDINKLSSTHSYLYNSNDAEIDQDFEYNSTYYWRVRVKDIKGAFSDWVIYNDFDDDDGNGYAESFSTPLHKYPDPDFNFSPNLPNFGEEIVVVDSSIAYDSSGNSNADLIKTWEWDFDGDLIIDKEINRTTEITIGDTLYVYMNPSINQYSIKLTVTDSDLFACSLVKQINIAIGEEYPRWNEIAPSN